MRRGGLQGLGVKLVEVSGFWAYGALGFRGFKIWALGF